jgi:hypothetical protein
MDYDAYEQSAEIGDLVNALKTYVSSKETSKAKNAAKRKHYSNF